MKKTHKALVELLVNRPPFRTQEMITAKLFWVGEMTLEIFNRSWMQQASTLADKYPDIFKQEYTDRHESLKLTLVNDAKARKL